MYTISSTDMQLSEKSLFLLYIGNKAVNLENFKGAHTERKDPEKVERILRRFDGFVRVYKNSWNQFIFV